jgi:hypothetical protein
MSKLKNLMHIGLITLVAANTEACMSKEAEPTAPSPFTTLNLANGAVIDFYEPIRGELLVAMMGDVPGDVEDLSPLAIYEALAGAPAPVVLREAQARADLALASRPPRHPAPEDVVTEPAKGGSSLTAAEFTAQWCSTSPVDFDHCWTDRTNNFTHQSANVDWIHAHANAYLGTISMTMYQEVGGVLTPVWGPTQVTGMANVFTQPTTIDGTYVVSILQAAGDWYHLSIHGEK